MTRLVFESGFEAEQATVFGFHERPEAMRLLTPWWSGARIIRPAASLENGQRVLIRLGIRPLSVDWLAEHRGYDPPRSFEDVQLSGPFKRWTHRHVVLAEGSGSRLRDEVDYELPGGPLAPLVDRLLVRPFLRCLFRYRHAVTRRSTSR